MDVVFWINWAIDHSDEQYLHNVIINCHGTPGFLHVGGSWVGFGVEGTSLFKSVRRGGVGTIWLVACSVAQNKSTNIGTMFCSELAKAAGCDVVAADALQHVDVTFYLRICPFGAIDDYEGNVSRFSPGGTSAPYDPAAG